MNFSEEGIQKAIESTKLGIWEYIIDKNIIIWNKHMFYLFDKKYENSNIVDYNDFLLKVHPDEQDYINSKVINATTKLERYDVKYRVIWNDKSIHYYKASAENYINKDNTYSLIGTVLDITDFYTEKEKEKEKILLQNKLNDEIKYNDEIRIIMRTVAHEIRNPLQGIIGSINIIDNILEQIVTTDLKIKEELKIIKEYIDNLMICVYNQLNILNDLIDYNLLQKNNENIEIKKELINLEEICINIIKMFKIMINPQNIKLSYTIDPNINKFIGDPIKIKRIIINLVSNSVKFTKDGYIHIDCIKKHNKCIIMVKDTGTGIIDKTNIFDSIGKSSTRSDGIITGSGLGLSICKKLAIILGGKIYCDDNIPNGTIFFFEFDLDYNLQNISKKNIKNIPELVQIKLLKNKNILLADDNKINQKIIFNMLKDIVNNITIVSNGTEVINEFTTNSFDILILDIHMPIMNGDIAAKIIRTKNTEIPIIFLTAELITDNLLNLENSSILLKPCNKNDLIQTCANMFYNEKNLRL